MKLELFDSNICGSIKPNSSGRNSYFISLIGDFSMKN